MGPHVAELFREEGADVLIVRDMPATETEVDRMIAELGTIDILVANFAGDAPRIGVTETRDDTFAAMYETMVAPLHRTVRAVLPQMIDRRSGKIVVMGSATGVRGVENTSAYSTARGAQLAYVRTVGAEMGPHNVQVNAIAQTLVANDTYFPPSVRNSLAIQQRIRATPGRRMAEPREAAALALFLASNESDFFFGQCIPFSGGWIS